MHVLAMKPQFMLELAAMAYDQVGFQNHESAENLIAQWMTSRFCLAVHLLENGFSVIPLVGKKPAVKWKRFQSELATIRELVRWFGIMDFEPAIVTGSISGVTVIDCDDMECAAIWSKNAERPLFTQKTKRGMHFFYDHRGERNTVRIGGVNIDRRGEGGYVRAYSDASTFTRASA